MAVSSINIKYRAFCIIFGLLSGLNGFVTAETSYASTCTDPQVVIRCIDPEPYLVKEYSVKHPVVLSVYTIAGNIELIASPDPHKIRVELYVDYGFSFWPFGNSLEEYRITNIRKGSEIIASVEKKSKERTSFWRNPTRFSYKVYIPSAISTNLKTLDGYISVEQVTGRHLLKSNGGNIDVTRMKGLLKAYTAGGNINIDNSKGMLYAHTDGGNITIERGEGEMRLQTNGGRISSTDITGSMVAKVNGGDIDVQFRHVGQGIHLEANAGNISLTVPSSIGYQLYASAVQVSINEERRFDGTYSTRLAEGAVNGGGIPIHLRASTGEIRFQLKED